MEIVIFVLGAAVFGAGAFFGAAVVSSNFDKMLKNAEEKE